MVLAHSTFKYREQIIIEKMKVRAPMQYETPTHNNGCFIYFKEKGPRVLSAEENTQLKGREAVLLNCGSHFLELFKEAEDDQVEVIIIHLFPDLLKKIYLHDLPGIIKTQTGNKRSQVVASSDVIEKFIESLEFYFQHPSLVNNDLLELKIKELILLLVQSKNINSILELVADLYNAKTVQLKEVIALHLFSNLRLEQIAKLCNLSLSSFKRQFKKEFNDSPTNYIISQRIQKAKELLSLSNLPIGEVAFEIGFHDPLYFARLFKKKVGHSPSAYRAENKG